MLPSKYLKIGWCRKHPARDDQLNPVHICSDQATQWCLIGSIYASLHSGSITVDEKNQLMSTILNILNIKYIDIPKYNDSEERTQDEIIQLMITAERRIDIVDHLLE